MRTQFFDLINLCGGQFLLFHRATKEMFSKPHYPGLIIEQVYQTGIRSIPLILVMALSSGMVMALQFGIGLQKFGGTLYVPKIVSLSIIKEIGPVFSGLMLAGRVAAGIASEVGSMKVTQQIDAIEALGTSPIKKIVIPRVLGVLISLPLLTVLANAVGVSGGVIVGMTELGLDPYFYYNKILETITVGDYLSGFCKSFFFALFIGISGCYYGLSAQKGTRSVGIATTRAVVTSSLLILIGDFFLTKLFWMIQQWLS